MEWQIMMVELRDRGKLLEFESGKPFPMDRVEIQDAQNYERIYAKAIICKDPTNLPEGEVLWIKNYREERIPEPARIKILERIPNPYESFY